MIGLPLGLATLQDTVTCPKPAVAVTFVGAEGTPAGVTETARDGDPEPTAFFAATVIEYVSPFVKLATAHDVARLLSDVGQASAMVVFVDVSVAEMT